MKKLLALSLALVMCLSIMAIPAFAADYPKTDYNGRQYQLFDLSMSWDEAQAYCENLGGHLVTITDQAEQSFIEGLIAKGAKNYYFLGGYCGDDRVFKWVTGEPMDFTAWASNEPLNYGGKQDKIIMYRVASPFNTGVTLNRWDDIEKEGWAPGYDFFSQTSFGFICEWENIASDWAQGELQKADALGLIPEALKGQDLSKSITRAEFAAVAVKVYENLTGTKTTPSATTTFTDTTDTEVLKAHNTNLMVGVSATTFEPNTLLNREQAATALTRVLKRAYIPGWTFATDAQFKLNFTRPATFADDAQISDWAKESVYFMAANEIIKGVGGNKFAPKNTTSAEEASNYANATREQAVIIGLRLVEKLKDKPVDYTGGEGTSENPNNGGGQTQTVTPPSGSQWMQLDKSNIVNGEKLIVTVFGITAQMVKDGAYVAMYKKGRTHDQFGEYHWIKKEGESQITFTDTRLVSGDWELRLFRNSSYKDEDFVTSVPFTIGE